MRNLKAMVALLLAFTVFAQANDWPQWMGENRDGLWREDGILEKFPEGGPKVLWRTPIDAGYAGPAVYKDKVIVTDHVLAKGTAASKDQFSRAVIQGTERVLCLNRADGKIVWTKEYDCPYDVSYAAGPRTTPIITDSKVYTLGTEGDLYCWTLDKGDIVWSHNFMKDFGIKAPMWGFSASPLLDGDKLITLAGGKGTTAVAYHKDTGKEIWRAIDTPEPGYCPPVIYDLNGKRQLIIWHPAAVNGLDPETGKVYWSQPFKSKANLSVPMPLKTKLADGSEALFITSFYNGAMLLKFTAGTEAPAVVWRSKVESETKTDTLNSIMPTPWIEGGHIYGICSYGQFRCLEIETGKRIWESFIPAGGPFEKPEGERWANAFVIKNGDRFFIPNEKGDLLIAKLSPKGYEEIGRAHLLEPTNKANQRNVVWSHPAFAYKCIFARNDKEIICVSLAK